VFTRTPNDGLYPKLKATKDLQPEDISDLCKHESWNAISDLINE